MTLRGRWYLAVPAKSAICISVYILYIFCVVKFKFNVILNAGSGSLAICGCVSKEIRRYTSRHVRIFSSRDEFLVLDSTMCAVDTYLASMMRFTYGYFLSFSPLNCAFCFLNWYYT